MVGKECHKVCEDGTYTPLLLPTILSEISDKFHLQVLNVADKKYKQPGHKREYYSRYQWVVCGSFFTCGVEVGQRVLGRLKELFVATTDAGYGHGDEMLYLEILDEFARDIHKGYGDYQQILHNFLRPTRNIGYVYHQIFSATTPWVTTANATSAGVPCWSKSVEAA